MVQPIFYDLQTAIHNTENMQHKLFNYTVLNMTHCKCEKLKLKILP